MARLMTLGMVTTLKDDFIKLFEIGNPQPSPSSIIKLMDAVHRLNVGGVLYRYNILTLRYSRSFGENHVFGKSYK